MDNADRLYWACRLRALPTTYQQLAHNAKYGDLPTLSTPRRRLKSIFHT